MHLIPIHCSVKVKIKSNFLLNEDWINTGKHVSSNVIESEKEKNMLFQEFLTYLFL